MILFDDNTINKIGNGNRIYLGSNLIYQLFKESEADEVYSLPDIPFIFNFNAKNYVDGVIPYTEGAVFKNDLVLDSTNRVKIYDDHIVLWTNKFDFMYVDAESNPLNRLNGEPLTIIAKVRNPQNSTLHLLSNRAYNYNWMFRIFDKAWLHTSNFNIDETPNVQLDNSQPNIIAIRCLVNGTGYGVNYTTGDIGNRINVKYGIFSDGFSIFGGGANTLDGENFNQGEFYWIYVSTEQLTDEQIQQVINYNENM